METTAITMNGLVSVGQFCIMASNTLSMSSGVGVCCRFLSNRCHKINHLVPSIFLIVANLTNNLVDVDIIEESLIRIEELN